MFERMQIDNTSSVNWSIIYEMCAQSITRHYATNGDINTDPFADIVNYKITNQYSSTSNFDSCKISPEEKNSLLQLLTTLLNKPVGKVSRLMKNASRG